MCRFLFPIGLLAAGIAALIFRIPVPGAPVFIPGSWPSSVTLDMEGNLYVADGNIALFHGENPGNLAVWKVPRFGRATKIAGDKRGRRGDGVPAVHARLNDPNSIAMDKDGNLYIADGFVLKVDRKGTLSSIGRNTHHYGFDVACDMGGSLYVADHRNNQVYRTSKSGLLVTIAGNGRPSHVGDGGHATKAGVKCPTGVAPGPDGCVYISHHDRIRRINPQGVITTIAGGNGVGYSGDGGPAFRSRLQDPFGITADAKGNVYFADKNNHCIRKVDRSGIITTVAGRRWQSYSGGGRIYIGHASGDGGLAVNALLCYPADTALDSDGNLYIADWGNGCVRMVSRNGIITTVTFSSGRFNLNDRDQYDIGG